MKRMPIILGMVGIFTLLNACNSVLGGAENTSGTESISAAPTAIDFSGAVGDTSYRTLTFTNRTAGNYLINNLAFVDNVCGDFSVYSITDSSGNVLYSFGQSVAVSVVAGQSVSINVKFSPTECETDEYTTTFVIYYQTDVGLENRTAELHAVVDQPTASGSEVECPEETTVKTYNDGLTDPDVERSLPAGEYYLRIDRIRSFIQPTGGFASYAIKVGTDINLDEIPDEDEFQPIYLPITSDGNGNITMKDVDECAGFKLPTPVTDTNLRGATAVLTITAASGLGYSTGTISDGIATFNDMNTYLSAHIGNTQSLIQDESSGDFAVTLSMNLTSGTTEPNSFLESVAGEVDDEGEPFLKINENGDDSTMYGSALRHGTVRIVGIGDFNGTDFVGSQIAEQALVENDAYIFIQIDGFVTTLKSEEPIE